MPDKTQRAAEQTRIRGSLVSGAPPEAKGMRWRCVIARSGPSLNGFLWTPEVLTKAAPLFEGSPVGYNRFGEFTAKDGTTVDGVGHLPDATFGTIPMVVGSVVGSMQNVAVVKSDTDGATEIVADLVLLPSLEALGARLVEMAEAGFFDGGPDARMGLSMDVRQKGHEEITPAGLLTVVEEIVSVTGTDVVAYPAAGGHLQRLVASALGTRQIAVGAQGDRKMNPKQKLVALLAKAIGEEKATRLTQSLMGDEVTAKSLAGVVLASMPTPKGKRAAESIGKLLAKIKEAIDAENSDMATALIDLAIEMSGGEEDAPGGDAAAMSAVPPVAADPRAAQAIKAPAGVNAADLAALVKAEVEKASKRASEATAAIMALANADLPEPFKADLKAEFEGREFTAADVLKRVEAKRALAGATLAADANLGGGIFAGFGLGGGARRDGGGTIEDGLTQQERILIALDKTMGGDPSRFRGKRTAQGIDPTEGLWVKGKNADEAAEHYRKVPAFRSLPEMFRTLCGFDITLDDRSPAAQRACQSAWRGYDRLLAELDAKSAPSMSVRVGRAAEAITVSDNILAAALANSSNRISLMDYRVQGPIWEHMAEWAPISDYKAVAALRYGHFPTPPTVAEAADFQDTLTARTQESISIAPTTYGYIVRVTKQAIRNDDLQLIRRVPGQMAQAHLRLINQAAANLLLNWITGTGINTDTIYDGNALYTNGHGNLNTAALSAAAIKAVRVKARKQYDPDTLDMLGLEMKKMFVPEDLVETAMTLRDSTESPETVNRATNVLYHTYEIISLQGYGQSDTDNWYMTTDPKDGSPLARIHFLDGEIEPVVTVQDAPTAGQVFMANEITYKSEHCWGMETIDFRAAQGSIVT